MSFLMQQIYKPVRQYKRDASDVIEDEDLRVHSTLLEYGKRSGLVTGAKSSKKV